MPVPASARKPSVPKGSPECGGNTLPRSKYPLTTRPPTAQKNTSARPQRPSRRCPKPGTDHAASAANSASAPRLAFVREACERCDGATPGPLAAGLDGDSLTGD